MCIPYLFYTFVCVCVCVSMFMWHMGLATDSKMSIKFYLLTYFVYLIVLMSRWPALVTLIIIESNIDQVTKD